MTRTISQRVDVIEEALAKVLDRDDHLFVECLLHGDKLLVASFGNGMGTEARQS